MNYKDISDHDKKEIDKFRKFMKGELSPIERREYEGYLTPKKTCKYELITYLGYWVCVDCEHVYSLHDRNSEGKWVCSECIKIWQAEEALND